MKINKRKKDDPLILTADQYDSINENKILTVDDHNKRLSPNIVSLTTEEEIEEFLRKERERDAQ